MLSEKEEKELQRVNAQAVKRWPKCSVCKRPLRAFDSGAGYECGILGRRRFCYACCGARDRAALLRAPVGWLKEKSPVLYLVNRKTGDYTSAWFVTNWPASFEVQASWVKRLRHPWEWSLRVERWGVWFQVEGQHFYGENIGDNQLVRCLRKLRPAGGGR